MSTNWGWALLWGSLLGAGTWMLIASLPRWRARISERVARYVTDVSLAAFEFDRERHESGPLPPALSKLIWRVLPSPHNVMIQLRRAGVSATEPSARMALFIGSACGITLAALLWITPLPAVVVLTCMLLGAVVGAYATSYLASKWGERRAQKITDEIPAALEFLSLTVAAGEALPDALLRLEKHLAGELSAEFASVNREVQLGVPLSEALRNTAQGLNISALNSLVSQLVAALERGNALTEVLRAQAADARVATHRRLLESAGRKEIAMLFPLVFLILPVTILFAVWPGIVVLNAGFLP